MIFSRNNRVFFVALGFVAFVTSILPLSASSARAESLLVFAAASLKETLEETGKAFTKDAGTEVKFSFAASSALAKQIEAGAPADLFASADLKWMDYLDEKKLIRSETRKNLIGNRLVIVAPQVSARYLLISPKTLLQKRWGTESLPQVKSILFRPEFMPRAHCKI